jgi:hypothetical protein
MKVKVIDSEVYFKRDLEPVGIQQEQFDFKILRESLLAIAFLCSLLSTTAFLLTYRYRKERVFRAASRTFMYM